MTKYVTDFSAARLIELTDAGIHISHCGSLWIVFFATEQQKEALTFPSRVDRL